MNEWIGNGKHKIKLTSDGSPEQNWDIFERGPRYLQNSILPLKQQDVCQSVFFFLYSLEMAAQLS